MARAEQPISERYRGVGFTFSPDQIKKLLRQELWREDRPGAVEEYWTQHSMVSDLQAMQGFDIRWFLPDDVLLKADRIGMHHNLEVRVPYCDHEVVSLALSIPLALRRDAFRDKKVLRQVARRHLPSAVVKRPKQGFPTPLTALLSGKLSEIAWDTLISPQAMNRGWFYPSQVEKLLNAMGPENPNGSRQVYALLMLELWMEELVEGARPGSVTRERYYTAPVSPV